MNNKGFVSTSIIYALFIAFSVTLVMLLGIFSNNRVLLTKQKEDLKEGITEYEPLDASSDMLIDIYVVDSEGTEELVNGKSIEEILESGYMYDDDKSFCNDGTIMYNESLFSIEINSDTPTDCVVYFKPFSTSFEEPGPIPFPVPATGYYIIESYGAQGSGDGGLGGVTSGRIYLEKGITLDLNIGGMTTGGTSSLYPGGGSSTISLDGNVVMQAAGGGGGAEGTDGGTGDGTGGTGTGGNSTVVVKDGGNGLNGSGGGAGNQGCLEYEQVNNPCKSKTSGDVEAPCEPVLYEDRNCGYRYHYGTAWSHDCDDLPDGQYCILESCKDVGAGGGPDYYWCTKVYSKEWVCSDEWITPDGPCYVHSDEICVAGLEDGPNCKKDYIKYNSGNGGSNFVNESFQVIENESGVRRGNGKITISFDSAE